MVKEAKEKGYSQWNLPACHVEENELVTNAAIREVYDTDIQDIKNFENGKTYPLEILDNTMYLI